MDSYKRTLTVAFWGVLVAGGCSGGGGGEMLGRLNEANDKVVACKKEVSDLKNEIVDLKQKVAQAATSPVRIQLTDPDILNLIAEIKKKRGPGDDDGDVVLGRGDLNPKEASRIVKQGAQALQKCYERALKKSSSLQYQTGLGVTLEITVVPSGQVKGMNLSPHTDAEMTECIRTTVAHWKFPPFSGESVVVAQKLTLTPKT